MVKLYEYIKMKLYNLGEFEHPVVAQLFYILDADIEKVRDLQAQVVKLRAEYVRLLDARLSKIDEAARIAFEEYTAGIPTVPKRILKAVYTARTIRRKAPLLWKRFKYSR
jgi:hypothetical protein